MTCKVVDNKEKHGRR